MVVQHKPYHQKGPAQDELPASAQEVQPASGAADAVLHCHHPVCSLFIHPSGLDWTPNWTGTE